MDKCAFNAALAKKGISKQDMASLLNISYHSLWNRITGHSSLRLDELSKIAVALDLTPDEVYSIFLT